MYFGARVYGLKITVVKQQIYLNSGNTIYIYNKVIDYIHMHTPIS